MKMGIRIGLVSGKTCRLVAGILLVLAGQAINGSGQAETVLYSFGGSPNDGANPVAALIQGSDGNFYGTTSMGGTNNGGTVFRINPSGSYSNLYSFGGSPTDGKNPYAGLVQGSDGNFYGTTEFGGTSTNCSSGCGTIFQISPAGTFTTLYSFSGETNSANPMAALVQGKDGFFYGTTLNGGSSTNCPSGCGTVYKINLAGTYTTLYSFIWGRYTSFIPQTQAGLVQGTDGYFYGTTEFGGSDFDYGSVFKISSVGTFTTLNSFTYSTVTNGWNPYAGLVEGADGNFYGTTFVGGHGVGTVFQISSEGTLTLLHAFGVINTTDGENPFAALVQGSDGYFYGTTAFGGTNAVGNVFKIGSAGTFRNVYQFSGLDGSEPEAALVQGSDGSFYGTTQQGGANNNGTVFKLTIPLNPPANQISGMQFSGADVVLNIPSVAYETYQLQFTTDPVSGTWSNVPGASVTNCIGGFLSVTNFGGALQPQGFYRFDITP